MPIRSAGMLKLLCQWIIFRCAFIATVALLIFAPFCNVARADTELYMLSDTLSQTVRLSKPLALADFGVSMTYATGATIGAYHLSGGNVAVTTLAGLYQYLGEVPPLLGKMRAIMEVSGRWKNQKNLQKIADIEGVEKLHVFTTGHEEYLGVIPTKLHTNSLVFIEADNAHLPEVFGSHWIPLKKDHDATVRLELRVKGAAAESHLEIPVHEFISGAELSESIKQEWKTEISNWKKALPLAKRYLSPKQFSEEVSIVGTLIYNGQEKALGEVAVGSGTKKLLSHGPIRSALNWIKSHVANVEEDKRHKFTRKVEVLAPEVESNVCVAAIKRLLGTALVKKAQSE